MMKMVDTTIFFEKADKNNFALVRAPVPRPVPEHGGDWAGRSVTVPILDVDDVLLVDTLHFHWIRRDGPPLPPADTLASLVFLTLGLTLTTAG